MVGEEMPVVGEEMPVVGEEMPVVGEEMPVVGEEMPVVGEEMEVVGEEMEVVGEEMEVRPEGGAETRHNAPDPGPARVLVENVTLKGRPARFRAGTAVVDDRIDELARSGGAGRIRATLEHLDVIAGSFDPTAVDLVRARLAAVLGTFGGSPPDVTGRLAARLAGSPFDGYRVEMLEGLVSALVDRPPSPTPAAPPTARWEWLAFFEAYFSNFIEGTEFGVDEARRIVVDGVVPETRPEDAHDVVATYRLAVDPASRAQVPRSGDELVGVLRQRHAVLMAARPDQRPGELKSILNYAGGYQFVEPELVEGTLLKGFELLDRLREPLS